MESVYQQYKDVKDSRVLVFFKGAVTQGVLAEFGSMIRTSLSYESKLKKIFAVFIELAQNIFHYSDERIYSQTGEESGIGIVIIDEKNDRYTLRSGNLISNEKLEKMKEKFSYINTLDKEGLKSYYQKLLKQPRPDESKGAGLGFVDIARKSDGPLGFEIEKVDEKYSFLTISVLFKKED
ncbi:MAG: hypothetical protein H7A23_24610 [Leptospiraceae bacterium]|nr:SiaB family protein kinase [Leptospiraceae bacterium]MCP5497748.1 hypothetical protein [Leptospiraceae bacterium]